MALTCRSRSGRRTARRSNVLTVADLVRIGVVLGPELLERVYRALGSEPRTDTGRPVDLIEIQAEVARLVPRDTYGVPTP